MDCSCFERHTARCKALRGSRGPEFAQELRRRIGGAPPGVPFDIPKIKEALYALNRAIDPDPEFPSAEQALLVDARDSVWTVLQLLDPTLKD